MLKIEKVNYKQYKLLEDITVSSCGYFIKVYEGFVFDGASVPRLFWPLVGTPFTGNYTEAALVHDALYASEILPRSECDDIFLELMKKAGVSYWKRYSMYWAVRAGGAFVWKEHTEDSIKENKRFIDVADSCS